MVKRSGDRERSCIKRSWDCNPALPRHRLARSTNSCAKRSFTHKSRFVNRKTQAPSLVLSLISSRQWADLRCGPDGHSATVNSHLTRFQEGARADVPLRLPRFNNMLKGTLGRSIGTSVVVSRGRRTARSRGRATDVSHELINRMSG